MTSPVKTKTNTSILNSKYDVNRLRQGKGTIKGELRSAEISETHSEKRKKTMKKSKAKSEERSVTKKIRNHNLKKSQSNKNNLTKNNRNKFSALPCPNLQKFYQNQSSEKNPLKAFFKHSQGFNIFKDTNQVFVSLNNINKEKTSKSKFKNPANGRELKRMREKLRRKSSYHKRFLGKSEFKEPQKKKKNIEEKVKRNETKQPPQKNEDIKTQKSENKISIDNETKEINEYANFLNPESQPPDTDESSKNDVSKVDENYLKSLLSIANCNSEQKEVQGNGVVIEKEMKAKMTGKEFFMYKIKNRKINQVQELKNVQNKKSDFICNQVTNTIRDATKSESQIKVCNSSDIKNTEVKGNKKKTQSKHEINNTNNNIGTNHNQKKKTRNIVKNKKQDKIEMPLPSEVLKTEDVQELWSRENAERVRNSQTNDFLATTEESHKVETHKDLGIESYQLLKRFVEEELYRISYKYNSNLLEESKVKNESENGNKAMTKELCGGNEKELPGLLRKKLLKKANENILHDEIQLQNAETLNLVNLLEKEKSENVKSKLKSLDLEKKSQNKKLPDEIVKNWSIVNRLEQAFLALGTPDFEKRVPKEPAKGMRATESNLSEAKRIDKKIKNVEENEKIAAKTHNAFNKQIQGDVNKSLLSEKQQVPSSHKKDSTTGGKKAGLRSSLHSIKSSKGDAKTKPREEQLPTLTRTIKPVDKPTGKLNKNSGIKPPTHFGNISGKQSNSQGPRKTGKLGKKNSSRPNSCETSTQIKIDDDNLERKKTFHIISLKDSVIMQPRRSKSCNKIERNPELVRIRSVSSTGSEECANLDFFNKREQDLDFWDFFNKIEKMKTDKKLKNKNTKRERKETTHAWKKTKSTDIAQARNSNQERKCEKAVPAELPEQVPQMKGVKQRTKVRPVKERSILSIRTNQPENRTSTSDVIQIQENCMPTFFHVDNLNLRKNKVQRGDVFPTPVPDASGTSCISTSTYDIPMPSTENSTKHIAQTATDNGGELELLKRPSGSSSKSSLEILPKSSTDKKAATKTVRNAPWEQDINHYRALVREIMSQYKRLGDFLKQSENVESLTGGSEELKALSGEIQLGNFKQGFNIQEYRKKIIQEYKQLPILEYKSKMQEIQVKPEGKSKRKNLLVVQTTNSETDLDVKDYEPSMRTVLGSRLYFDKTNFTKRKQIFKNSKEKKASLQEVILSKDSTPVNSSRAISTPKSCLYYFKPSRHSKSQYKSLQEDECQDLELDCVMPM